MKADPERKVHIDKPEEGRGEILSNAEIADQLASLAQLLAMQKENPYKIKAYHRAAAKIRTLSESVDELIRDDADLTTYAGIGQGISAAIREIVMTGSLERLEKLSNEVNPELASIIPYPRLDPSRVLRIYKKLGISSIESLRERRQSGQIESTLGQRMAEHVRQGLVEPHAMLLYKADDLCATIKDFLRKKCRIRAEVVGDYRRRVEVIEELDFIVETDDVASLIPELERYGGRTPLLSTAGDIALFALSSGIKLQIRAVPAHTWGLSLIQYTGSTAHLKKLSAVTGSLTALKAKGDSYPAEKTVYEKFSLSFIEPELREGYDEVARAAQSTLPVLVTGDDVRGELHAHSTSSDGSHSVEQMALAARDLGYEYLGITDHSQSLKIARGVTVEDLWKQVRFIDNLNNNLQNIRVLKSAEVDILADGSLDYPDDLLRELDYTVCSIHSRFGLGKTQQTERILRAMDNRYFNILGHPTGRLLLRRPGYEIDFSRIVAHAKHSGCFFEINSSPDRLDLSSENARLAVAAQVKIAICTDAHSIRELGNLRYGVDQARRAGIGKSSVLNCLPWESLLKLFKR